VEEKIRTEKGEERKIRKGGREGRKLLPSKK
jgi:hypothetical protein